MALDAWFPVGLRVDKGLQCHKIVEADVNWQIYESLDGARALVARQVLADRWQQEELVSELALVPLEFGGERFRVVSSGPHHALGSLSAARSPGDKAEAMAFAVAVRETRRVYQRGSLHDAVYVERLSRLLPTWTLSPGLPDDVVLGTWLTGGVRVSVRSVRRLNSLMGWLSPEDVRAVVDLAGPTVVGQGFEKTVLPTESADMLRASGAPAPGPALIRPKTFELVGRPSLERFFREHVIDIVENLERYRHLGVEFPSAIVLHGPPGCGKTYAVDRLVDYLSWPSFSIDSSSIGSPYIHDTARKIAGTFDKATETAPSVIVIDEMDSFLSERNLAAGSGLYHVEEVSEFLRRIPEAIKNRVLVVGMTNRLDIIDPALLRRGRFDHLVEVGMPSSEEVASLLAKLLGELPCDSHVEPSSLVAALTGRPLSDVAFVVREGARLAGRAGRTTIDQQSLDAALNSLPEGSSADSGRRHIGFK